MNSNELRSARRMLAEVVKSNGFTWDISPQTVSRLTKNGFSISGRLGAEFSPTKGLTVWNKASRHSGSPFTVKQLATLEDQLGKVFDEVWEIWGDE